MSSLVPSVGRLGLSDGADPRELVACDLPAAGGGRSYQVGPMQAVFKADGAETDDRYCVSEWWLEPGDSGPGPHSHEDNVEIFYVIEGTMSFAAQREQEA